MIYCQEAIKLHNLSNTSCCDSCHDEWDEGYGDPIELYIGDKTYYVCCGVMRALEDKGIK